MNNMVSGRVLFLPNFTWTESDELPTYQWPDTASCTPIWNMVSGTSAEGMLTFDVDPDWNRWILSHHLSFLLWALAIDDMRAISMLEESSRHLADRVVRYIDAYGASLLYARLIGPENYERYIRPTMRQFFPGFSATWSKDYQAFKLHVHSLTRNGKGDIVAPIKQAFLGTLGLHIETAKALVPSGPSLLQEIKAAQREVVSNNYVKNFVYDSLFLVNRANVTRADLAGQLAHRAEILKTDPNFRFDSAIELSIREKIVVNFAVAVDAALATNDGISC